MTDKEPKPEAEFFEQAAMISMDWFDIEPIARALQNQYQRGFEAGKAASTINAEQLKAHYERGRNDYKRELFAKLDDMKPGTIVEASSIKAPIASSIEEEPSKPIKSIEIAKPGRGPKPTDVNRPEGIPSNYEMCRQVLADAGVPMSGSEIRDVVAKRWWPNVPVDWKSSPFGFLSSGKLRKSADNKFILPAEVVKPTPPAPQEVINREVAKRQEPPRAAVEPFKPRMPAPEKKLGPPARTVHGEAFMHAGKKVILHPREYLLTSKLYGVKGQHIGTQFLAQNALGIKDRGGDSESLIRDLVSIINPKIEGMGLKIGFYKGAGFIMQDAG